MRGARNDAVLAIAALATLLTAATAPATAFAAGAPPALGVWPESLPAHELRLRRAARHHDRGELHAVVETLEPIGFTSPTFAESDRAAFLLAHAYLELGAYERFDRLAVQVAGWSRTSPWTEWIGWRASLAALERGARERAVVQPGALTAYLGALGREANHEDATAAWTAVAQRETTTALDKDLAGAARIELATRALARGEDPRPLLEGVAATSRFRSRARHVAATASIERGDRARGRAELEALLREDPAYAGRRQVRLALAALAMDEARWGDAVREYEHASQDWEKHRSVLDRMLERGDLDELWWTWERNPAGTDLLTLDGAPARAAAAQLAATATDLTVTPRVERTPLDLTAPAPPSPWTVPPPTGAERAAVADAERRAAEARYELSRTGRAIAREHASLDDLRRYLDGGRTRNAREADSLAARAATLARIRAALAELEAQLRSVRDAATRRMLERAAAVLEDAARHQLWIDGMRRFHAEGPEYERARVAPAGAPTADQMLAGERALAEAIVASAERLAAEVPDLLSRSHDHAWRPRLAGRAMTLGAEAERLLAWSQGLAVTIDSGWTAAGGSAALRALEARAARLARSADSLDRAADAHRHTVARAAIERARAALDTEREAIDYGLASATYAWSVSLPLDPRPTEAPRAVSATARATTAPADPAAGSDEDPATVLRRDVAITRLRTFLQRHPQSQARGESRFRLADLMLVQERQRFRASMARFVAAQQSGRGGVDLPVLYHEPAVELYRRILAEDAGFEHRDATLFNGGVILAEVGDLDAERWLERLVKEHPASADVQHAWLRLADLRFDRERYEDAATAYGKAATGGDAGLRAIALYKLGWAHFERDRYAAAATSFAAVLDLDLAEPGLAARVNLRREAETYLVHALARAGGAPAYARLFPAGDARPYALPVLLALGQHLRRWQLHTEAAAADELLLARHAMRPEALLAAERLVDTHRRAGRDAEARRARLALAPRFTPGSEWTRAQSDSARAAGASFARNAWLALAAEDHGRGREAGNPEHWRGALESYERVLATFPDDPRAPELHVHAGEASLELGRHAGALEHFARAAATAGDSLAAAAMGLKVSAWDDAYTRASRAGAAASVRDSLARAVIAAGDATLKRFPAHASAASLRWRQGHLALAHGDLARAATDFEALATHHPRDARAPLAAALRADALFRLERFDDAGAAYEAALAAARAARHDSLARRAAAAVPVSFERAAEASVAADSTRHAEHARRFEQVASRFPDYSRAPAAQYRAALAWLAGGDRAAAVRAFETLIRAFPKSDLVRDAHVRIAHAWEGGNEHTKAAQAWLAFAERYRDDPEADESWLRAADLHERAGDSTRAEALRLAYLERWADDVETALEVLEPLARRELAGVGPARPITAMLDPPSRATGTNARTASSPPPSRLAAYLRHARQKPALAAPDLVAQVRFLEGEHAYAAYVAAPLRLPLERSIAAKQKQLDSLVAAYRRAVAPGAGEWSHAATYRIGEALLAFGTALEQSERPADLQGDDRLAYEDVLFGHRDRFYDRGERVWMDLLRAQRAEHAPDRWVTTARERLWARLGERFAFRPEADHPVAEAEPAPRRVAASTHETEEP